MRKVLCTLCVLSFVLLAFISVSTTVFAASSEVELEWDPSITPDVTGYKVYYKMGSSGAPYDGTGATGGDSPIDVGNVTTYTLHNLIDGTTYFVVTAYDAKDNESDYSNEVSDTLDTEAPAPPQNLLIRSIMKIVMWLKGVFGGGCLVKA